MELYTRKELLAICQDVAEKVCANSLDESYIEELCDYSGTSHFDIEINNLIRNRETTLGQDRPLKNSQYNLNSIDTKIKNIFS
jgi:hypothetical protein